MHCTHCFTWDGVMTNSAIQTLVTNDKTGAKFDAFVCQRCLTLGRITRATCLTFKNAAVSKRSEK